MSVSQETTALSRIPSGVSYFFGEEVRLRREVERRVLDVFTGWSYGEILLPVYDYYDMFARGMGTDRLDSTFCFTDAEGGLLALRPDLTSLVARTVATRFVGQPRPIRLCYVGEIFRNLHTPGRAPRQSWQIGAEIFGNDRLEADVEVLLIAIEALQRLGIADFKISLGHAGFLKGIAEELGLDAPARHALGEIVDSRSRAALAGWLAARNLDRPELVAFFNLSGNGGALREARALVAHPTVQAALDDLEHLLDVAETLDFARFLTIDFAEVGGLDYYTGMTFKIFCPGLGADVASGGRYDHLLKSFGADEPAVGFQFSLDRLADLVRRRREAAPLAATVLEADRDDLTGAFKQARELRETGAAVEIRTARHSLAP